MFEEESLFEQFSAELAQLEDLLYSIKEDSKEIEKIAPDAAEDVIDKLVDAMDLHEETIEFQDEVREFLAKFLDKAAIAANLYDKATATQDPAIQKEALRARSIAENARKKLDNKLDKMASMMGKLKIAVEKTTTRLNIAQIKARTQQERERNKKVRINFTLPENMKDDWKQLADELGISVSEMIRDAMEEFKQGMKSLEGLDKDLGTVGKKIGKFGKKMSKFVETQIQNSYPFSPSSTNSESGIPSRNSKSSNFNANISSSTQPIRSSAEKSYSGGRLSIQEKERLKKRITGLIRIQNGIPIDKLAQALKQTPEDAENLIYELVAEGIDGKLESDVFKYKSKPEEVIETFHRLIDRM
ncbi:MAG: ribbon-helix-helix protein, CopG family [Candidatus Lokiarchaeota archaeon]|nr:ribbon-helix-helix protein, CopG family [Candidatus Harpocratesius repetitus]